MPFLKKKKKRLKHPHHLQDYQNKNKRHNIYHLEKQYSPGQLYSRSNNLNHLLDKDNTKQPKRKAVRLSTKNKKG